MKELSRDHKPENPEEKERIEGKGGVVSPIVDSMGRDIGDYPFHHLSILLLTAIISMS